jgi:hypothetical protein
VAVLFLATPLLAGAAALGVGTALENRPETWRSTGVVRLVPGPERPSGNLQADLARYLSTGSTRQFTESVAEDAGLPKSTLRGDLEVQQRAPGQVGVVVLASSSHDAAELAVAAGKAVAKMIRTDQAAKEPNVRARLRAGVVVASTQPIKTEPRTQDALLGAALSASVVLVLAIALGAFLLNRRARREVG